MSEVSGRATAVVDRFGWVGFCWEGWEGGGGGWMGGRKGVGEERRRVGLECCEEGWVIL